MSPPATGPARFRKIVVPMDFSASAHAALEVAQGVARAAGPAHLVLVHAYFLPTEIESLIEGSRDLVLEALSTRAATDLEKILVELQEAGVSSEFVTRHGNPETVILQTAAEAGADLIVMGTHGRTGISRLVLGSVAERVLRGATCPVVTVRGALP